MTLLAAKIGMVSRIFRAIAVTAGSKMAVVRATCPGCYSGAVTGRGGDALDFGRWLTEKDEHWRRWQ